ncbi:MAG TPA: caspase family protein [Kofleriaceae bacterium]|nr:caspase family protein [Kofleriaceae bacterium]
MAAVVCGLAAPARAEVERFAVVIGHDEGLADEQRLQFAEKDASQVADVLDEIGGVPAENQVVLRGKNADQVRRALIDINDRIRSSGHDSVLVVYYSGHGDAESLHLGDTKLALRELEQLVRGSAASVRVLVIDACRSGSLTRTKGSKRAIDVDESLPADGVIVFTASTLGEDAQESEKLGGSFFTHYLVSGMRGAADTNSDGVVTASEAFEYTREQTILESSRSSAGAQHPTFEYDLRGRADLTLSRLAPDNARGTLVVPPGATWLVVRTSPSKTVIAEIGADAKQRKLSLRAGSYAVQGRTRDALLEGSVKVAAAKETSVDSDSLTRTMYARLVRKGRGDVLPSVAGFFAGATVMALPGSLALPGVVGGFMYVLPAVTLSPRISAVHGWPDRFDGGVANLLVAELRITRAWELPHFSVDLGGSLGGSYLDARESDHAFHDTPAVISRHAGPMIGAAAGVTRPLSGRLFASAELALQSHFLIGDCCDEPGVLLDANLFLGGWL